MDLTNEEMESLNRAYEIISKYTAIGGLMQNDIEHYEHMVIAIIDQYGTKDHDINSLPNTYTMLAESTDSKKRFYIQQFYSLLCAAYKILVCFQFREAYADKPSKQIN